VPSWERIARLAELSDRRAVRAERNGHPLCLSLADGVPVAVADACAHRRTPLSGGLVRDGILTCPGHFWRYDLRTGQCINRPDRVASHPCRVVDGWVDVLVPDPAPALGVRAMLLAAARRHPAAGPTMAGGDDPPAPS
jgi:nitrite reductase/ring-hydroxylating ferredoxin subunit